MIKLGPAGFGGNAIDGLHKVKELGLTAAEVEFTYGVNMSNETAKKVGEVAKELKIGLSVHAPYYINLASEEKAKLAASKKRILQSCERAHHLGAKYIVFHAAYYGKRTPEKTYGMVKKAILDMQKVIKQKKWNVKLAPETTGKISQFGSLDELTKLAKETKCSLCVDFAHLLAREGKIDYNKVFKKIKGKHIHSHFSGVEYTQKGERRHLLTTSAKIKELLKYIKKYKADITIINESPDPYGDSLKTLKLLK